MSCRTAAVALLVFALAPALRAAEPPSDEARPGVLLLHNGQLVQGKIRRQGDRFEVQIKSGELRIKASDVEFHCRTAQECYEKRRAGIDQAKADDRLNLAEWCIRQGLYEDARAEIRQAVRLDAAHPKISLLERRLDLVSKQRAPTAAPLAPTAGSVSIDELDRLSAGLPSGAMETFTSTIQPLLINHCSTAACHGPQSTSALRLSRLPVGRLQSRRSTQRNLHAVLETVDSDHPDASPLLTVPVRPHGTAKTAIFTSREAGQYKTLSQWVQRVAGVEAAAKSAPGGEASAPAVLPGPAAQAVSAADESADEPAEVEPQRRLQQPGSVRPREPAKHSAPKRTAPKIADPLKSFVPRDEFDPEIFNRRASGG